MLAYLRNEASYRNLYASVWTYADWAASQGLDKRDAGIDLVAQTHTGEVHAIQCKLYAPDWANDIAKIARTHIDRIQGILENPANTKEKQAFEASHSINLLKF